MKSYIFRMLHFLLARKILSYSLLSLFFHNKINYNKTRLEKSVLHLNALHTDIDKPCINKIKNSISRTYDLHVIIPAYNVSEFIGNCIESVLKQKTNYKVFITIVNDGSTDNTGEIIEKYKYDDNIEIINQENRGLSGARNKALESIKGKYITFLDSDDELADISEVLDLAMKNDADIVEGSYECFNGNTILNKVMHRLPDEELYGYPWGKIIKAELFENIIFPDGYWFEDTLMTFVLYPFAKKKITSASVMYRYRINLKGITKTSVGNNKSLDSLWVTQRLLKDRKDLGLINDECFTCVMIGQIKTNFLRISSLNSLSIDRDVFLFTIDLYEKYFSYTYCTENPVVKSLRNRDFGSYILACLS